MLKSTASLMFFEEEPNHCCSWNHCLSECDKISNENGDNVAANDIGTHIPTAVSFGDFLEIDEEYASNFPIRKDSNHIDAANVFDLENLIFTYLSPHEPGYVFFDVDETVVQRDTAFVYGFESTNLIMEQLSTSAHQRIVSTIGEEMERDYYAAQVNLVDPELKNIIASLQKCGHHVFALTSNKSDSDHVNSVIAAMKANGIQFSDAPFSGKLQNTMASIENQDRIGGIIFCNKESDNKGSIIVEFLNLIHLNSTNAKARNLHCVLVDNTEAKCNKASLFVAEECSEFLFQAIHYTQAEDSVTSIQLRKQLSRILSRLHLKGDESISSIAKNCWSVSRKPCFYQNNLIRSRSLQQIRQNNLIRSRSLQQMSHCCR